MGGFLADRGNGLAYPTNRVVFDVKVTIDNNSYLVLE